MSRIHKAFEIRFRTLLVKVNARRLEAGVTKLMQRAYQRAADLGISRPQALLDIYSQVSQRPAFRQEFALPVPVKFACDCGLGGLARWLRAAGYEASWQSHISDDALLNCTLQSRLVLLTTDSLLMERTPLRTGQVPALWLPPSFSPQRQLESVLAHFRLPLLPSRCMACGGELAPVPKEGYRNQIPPRAYGWRDEFFLCRYCGRIFWHGTHWERIRQELQRASAIR